MIMPQHRSATFWQFPQTYL